MVKQQDNGSIPADLSDASVVFWHHVTSTFELEMHHLKILEGACRSWDRAEEARSILARDGVVQTDRFGQKKPHPGVQIERDSRAMFCRCLRELALDVEEAPEPGRPPAIRGNIDLRSAER